MFLGWWYFPIGRQPCCANVTYPVDGKLYSKKAEANEICIFEYYSQFKTIIMDLTSLLIFLALGALAGWLAGLIMKGGGFGLVVNIIVGIVGAVIGGWVFSFFGFESAGLIGSIITAVVGAVILLAVIGLFKKG